MESVGPIKKIADNTLIQDVWIVMLLAKIRETAHYQTEGSLCTINESLDLGTKEVSVNMR
jgi:hypothetical protein